METVALVVVVMCFAIPVAFIIKNKLENTTNKNNTQNNDDDILAKQIENSPEFKETIKTNTQNKTNNNILQDIANNIAIIKFWVNLFAILQIIAFFIGIIMICSKCS